MLMWEVNQEKKAEFTGIQELMDAPWQRGVSRALWLTPSFLARHGAGT